jgi:hypothetical protein
VDWTVYWFMLPVCVIVASVAMLACRGCRPWRRSARRCCWKPPDSARELAIPIDAAGRSADRVVDHGGHGPARRVGRAGPPADAGAGSAYRLRGGDDRAGGPAVPQGARPPGAGCRACHRQLVGPLALTVRRGRGAPGHRGERAGLRVLRPRSGIAARVLRGRRLRRRIDLHRRGRSDPAWSGATVPVPRRGRRGNVHGDRRRHRGRG